MSVKVTIFWDVTRHGLLHRYCCLEESATTIFYPESEGSIFFQYLLHDNVISQGTVISIYAAIKISECPLTFYNSDILVSSIQFLFNLLLYRLLNLNKPASARVVFS